jgi:hypothetical protein
VAILAVAAMLCVCVCVFVFVVVLTRGYARKGRNGYQ